ncbi:AraD1 family protein [Aliamphritea hakodatensis]|uniref:AraD1 family protein n=1 Tax=Aliamphritea hakodatensis TaxID=2895352 RepID=UPI0022FD9C7D|nr:AraD1 family protein [Aliamphritea hakodatensis]
MRLIQCIYRQQLRVACVESASSVRLVNGQGGTYALAIAAISNGNSLQQQVELQLSNDVLDYQRLIDEGLLCVPVSHPDPAYCLVSGTGLTHLGSADTRASMHSTLADETALTDSMKMFRMGLKSGKPATGETGAQPEWFYKGNGNIIVAPEDALPVPGFAKDAGEEPELVGIYLIGPNGQPFRLGFAIGNEFSDHVTERVNYLWLAHSKLRACSLGPELLLGDLPDYIEGESRIIRDGKVLWRKPFLTGEANMSHSIANLEAHHFKYAQFCRVGDLHVHYMGTATLSFADGIRTVSGDRFEIEASTFGRALRNRLSFEKDTAPVRVKQL